MTTARIWALLLIAAGVVGCQEDEEKPPPYSPVAVPGSLVPCEALHDGTAQMDPSGGAVRYDGGLAECFPNELVCTVGPCDAGLGVARCVAGRWLWGCEPVLESEGEAGAQEAGDQDAQESSTDGG